MPNLESPVLHPSARLHVLGLLPVKSTEGPGPKIDFVVGSPTFAERVTGAFIDKAERLNEDKSDGGPSDHAPVVVDLKD